jgi:3',5'-cyclic AMP phosphodiesterase CpdA
MRAGVVAGAAGIAGCAASGSGGPTHARGGKPFRVAHLTDMHVEPERRAGEGYVAALESLEKLSPRPDLIVTGGDHVMDTTFEGSDRSRVQWDVYARAMRTTKLPVCSILGNHDVFGWGVKDMSERTAGYGKALAMDRLGLERPYYSFDAGGWHFVMLDSMQRREFSYTGSLGEEQTEWLAGDLASHRGKRTIVFSHIPILSVCVFFDGKDRPGEKAWNVPNQWMHGDARPIVDLLDANDVKLAVSGHIHLVDRCAYRGVEFICDGAVSGNWWKGPLQQFPEGYGVIDLWPDGTFEHRYLSYGWKAENDKVTR